MIYLTISARVGLKVIASRYPKRDRAKKTDTVENESTLLSNGSSKKTSLQKVTRREKPVEDSDRAQAKASKKKGTLSSEGTSKQKSDAEETQKVKHCEGGVPPAKKPRKTKTMNKKEQDDLLSSLSAVDFRIVYDVVKDKLREQVLPERLKLLADKLLESEQLIKGIILFHQKCFGKLYTECKKDQIHL